MIKKCLLLFCVVICQQAKAQDVDVDHLGIAALMLKNQYVSRARKSLESINLKNDDVERSQYYTLWGMTKLYEKKYEGSLTDFERAIKEGQENTEVYLYIAEAHFHLKNYKKSRVALSLVSKEVALRPAFFLLKSSVEWILDEQVEAFNTLNQATVKDFKNKTLYIKKKFSFFIGAQLYRAAYESVLKSWRIWDEASIIAFAVEYRELKQPQLAIALLEEGMVRWPESSQIVLELAQNYLSSGMKWSAAILLEDRAKRLPELAYEASQLLRDVGLQRRAEFINLEVLDPAKNIKNRLALYLDADSYSMVSRLSPQLNQYGILKDEDIRYALAYSQFKTGDFKKAEYNLNQLTSEANFRKAIEIKKLIETCKETKWSCYETF